MEKEVNIALNISANASENKLNRKTSVTKIMAEKMIALSPLNR